MPIYEYRCKKCANIDEVFVTSGEDVTVRCSNCGSDEMEKIMSPATFVFGSSSNAPGRTCCGREERCDTPPCSAGGGCKRDN